jgi:hypothetical protein
MGRVLSSQGAGTTFAGPVDAGIPMELETEFGAQNKECRSFRVVVTQQAGPQFSPQRGTSE